MFCDEVQVIKVVSPDECLNALYIFALCFSGDPFSSHLCHEQTPCENKVLSHMCTCMCIYMYMQPQSRINTSDVPFIVCIVFITTVLVFPRNWC